MFLRNRSEEEQRLKKYLMIAKLSIDILSDVKNLPAYMSLLEQLEILSLLSIFMLQKIEEF